MSCVLFLQVRNRSGGPCGRYSGCEANKCDNTRPTHRGSDVEWRSTSVFQPVTEVDLEQAEPIQRRFHKIREDVISMATTKEANALVQKSDAKQLGLAVLDTDMKLIFRRQGSLSETEEFHPSCVTSDGNVFFVSDEISGIIHIFTHRGSCQGTSGERQ